MRTAVCAASVLAIFLGGCAANKGEFYASPSSVGGWSLCRAWVNAHSSGDRQFSDDLAAEAAQRGLTFGDCQTRNTLVEVGAVTVVVLGVVAAAMAGGGGGGSGGDSTFAWDQFMANDGSMMWACRGRQTGRFADQWRCSGLPMNDYTWPGPRL